MKFLYDYQRHSNIMKVYCKHGYKKSHVKRNPSIFYDAIEKLSLGNVKK